MLATGAAAAAGYHGFTPDACLINRYEPGSRLSPHQDRNERDVGWPIVSVSLGLPAVFQFGGATRANTLTRFPVHHGDVAVWGGASRLFFHGVAALRDGEHPLSGADAHQPDVAPRSVMHLGDRKARPASDAALLARRLFELITTGVSRSGSWR